MASFGALVARGSGAVILLDSDAEEDHEGAVTLHDVKFETQQVQQRSMAKRTLSWACAACTFENEQLQAPVCAVCQTPRSSAAAAAAAAAEDVAPKTKRAREQPTRPAAPESAPTPSHPSRPANALALLRPPPSLPPKSSLRAPPDAGAIPRCEVGDVEGIRRALREAGCVLLRGVATREELAHAEGLFYEWLESLPLGIRRSDPRTMRSSAWKQLGYGNTGVIANFSVGQSEFMWYLRRLPRVRQAFASVWGLAPQDSASSGGDLPPLITSFDGCGAQRNVFLPGAESDWRTAGRWFHIDQNHRIRPGLHTYQGVLNFYPSDGASGSTVLVPGSHRRFAEVCAAHPKARGMFVKLAEGRSPGRELVAEAVQAVPEPGDLLVWDSRVVHCNQGPCPLSCRSPGDTAALRGGREAAPLSRLVAYIAMVPAARLTPALAEARRACVREGRCTGHDATYVPQGGKRTHRHPSYRPPEASHPLWHLVAPGY